MSEFKADMGRNESLTRTPLNTAPPTSVQKNGDEKQSVNASGKVLPDSNVVKVAMEADPKEVESAVAKLNDHVQNTSRTLNFQVDDESGKTVIKVYDRESEKLIRQIPNEMVLELARRLNEEEPSLLFKAQV